MRWLGLLARLSAIAVGLLGTAAAQPASEPSATETVLHLSATGSVLTSPGQLVADLVAEATSPSTAIAQRRVNALIGNGLAATRAVAGVDARAIGYSVFPDDDKHVSWTAQQTLELHGSDGPALLDLAGRLQQEGLAAASLDWQLSPALHRQTHEEATTAALKDLQARAASAAATLGLKVDHLRDVTLDTPEFQPRRPFGMMAMAARAAPLPQATAALEDVTADVSADVALRR